MLTDAQIADVKSRADLRKIAQDHGAELRKKGAGFVGSCPLCGGGKRATRFEIKPGGHAWVCAVCEEGGDPIRLVSLAQRCDFRAAIDYLGGVRVLSEEEERSIAARRKREEDKRARDAEAYRLRAIAGARAIWDRALRDGREKTYLSARRVLRPASAMLRFAPDLPYFEGETVDELGRRSPRIIHTGPAMPAAILDNDGAFIGAHLTYLRLDLLDKLTLLDPDSGEKLAPKKVRGSKAGGHIVLRDEAAPQRLFMGEGNETVLSVATAFFKRGALKIGDAFWSSVDLGNLGGPAEGTIAHPNLTNEKTGRPLRIPSDVPADGPAIIIPPTVRDLYLLGDGDSEEFLTKTTLRRAWARYARPGLAIHIRMAPAGTDFNDIIKGDDA